jgi:dephospho-CoA kinase
MVAPQDPATGATHAAAAETLDPEALATCHQLAGVLFPWDVTRALELALLKTFCVPSIAGLLDRTGEFSQRPRKRYDDTGLMVAELLRQGPDSAAGRAVIARMNRIHGHYAISNDDFLYVLSTFVAEPIRWLERYGWRRLSVAEQQATYRFWRRVGQQMGITAIPESLEELLAFNEAFEAERFAAAPANGRVAEATLMMLLQDWPAPLRPALRRLLQALPEAAVTVSLDWPEPPPALQRAIRAGLRLRSRLANAWQQLLPPRGTRFYCEQPTPSYGPTFQLEQLGPPPLLPLLNRPRWQGPQRRIGLTGGIASGKSSVGRLLAERGLPLLDADVFAREALAPGSPGARAVLQRYGERVRAGDSHPDETVIDRAALGRIVFADAAERRWLEQLVHPLVRARFEAELEALAEAPIVVLVIPLLFEVGLEALCSEVWLVDCDADQQLQRLMVRDRLSEADARARLAAQWPLARKRPLAERLIDNRADPAALPAQLRTALGRSAGPSID